MGKTYDINEELEEFLKNIKDNKSKNVSYLKKIFDFSETDAEDIFQDSCYAMYKNIEDGKLVSLTSRLTTYFTQICINLSKKKKRDSKESVSLENGQYDSNKIEELIGLSDSGLRPKQIEIIHFLVSQLPSPCEEILWSFYSDRLSMDEIALRIGSKSGDSVKTQKSRCLSKLVKSFDKKVKEYFYDED